MYDYECVCLEENDFIEGNISAIIKEHMVCHIIVHVTVVYTGFEPLIFVILFLSNLSSSIDQGIFIPDILIYI